MLIEDDEININKQQLMLNYAFGHPNSDLLLLPIGPMVNFINHNQQPNAIIRWHNVKEQHKKEGALDRREEYHHPELFKVPAETVVKTHGKGLMIDIVALRDIKEGEEIYLDYGKDWQKAWEMHTAYFNSIKKDMPEEFVNYVSAERELAKINKDQNYYRTVLEEGTDPYPDNLKFFCFYEQHDDESEDEDDKDAYRKKLLGGRGFRRFSYNDHPDHPCIRPCTIVERYDDENGGEPKYSVEMYKSDNHHVMYYCGISMDYFYMDVPHSDIRLLDREYTTDVFIEYAFRKEIGVPDGFFPDAWMKKKLRQRNASNDDPDLGDEFKVKTTKPLPKMEKEVETQDF
jgi:hypothetical protein